MFFMNVINVNLFKFATALSIANALPNVRHIKSESFYCKTVNNSILVLSKLIKDDVLMIKFRRMIQFD